MEAISISDCHLGSSVSQAELLSNFINNIYNDKIITQKLIINGDAFDSWDFRRFRKNHWQVLEDIRRLAEKIEVVWINGNHDEPAETISSFMNIKAIEEYQLISGDKKILFLHGHRFDTWINAHPTMTKFVDVGYRILMKLDSSFKLARAAKRASKTFMKNSERIETKSLEYALELGCDIVCVGHTHFAVSKPQVGYFNSGCWTETPCTFLSVDNGNVELHTFKN